MARRSAIASLSQHARSLSNASRDRIVVADAGGLLDHLGERPVRNAFPEGQAAAAQDRRPLDALGELADEPALADARLSENGDEVRAAVAYRPRVRVVQEVQLDVAPDERRGRKRAPGLGGDLDEPPRRERLGAAGDKYRLARLGDDAPVREPPHARADQDPVLGRGLLEARGEVHGLAGRESGLGVLDDDLAGLDADANLQSELRDGGHDLQSRPQGALGVVLVRQRHAERGHHGVAGELLDGAAVRLDAARDVVEVAVDALADDLGIGT